MVFFGQPRHAAAGHAEESPKLVTVPLMVLAGLATLGGLLNFPGLDWMTNWLARTIPGVEAGTFNFVVAGVSTGLALVAIGLSWLLYQRKPLKAGEKDPLKRMFGPVYTVLERRYWVDELYAAVIVNRYGDVARFLADVIDTRFWHDWFHETVIAGSYQWLARTLLSLHIDTQIINAFFDGLAKLTGWVSARLRRLQNGFVRSYALAVLAGVVIIVGYLILK